MSEWCEEDMALMEKYLNGDLSGEELRGFEEQLKADKTLQQRLKTLSDLKEGIVQAGRKDLLNEIKQWEENEMPIARVIPIWKQSWSVGIAAVLVIGITAILLWPLSENNNELFENYFAPYPNVIMPTVRGGEVNDTSTIQKAYRAYDEGNYTEAAQFFESLPVKDAGALFYLGNSYLVIHEPEKAIQVLEKLVNEHHQLNEEAKWYLGLAYLHNHQEDKAIPILNEISNQPAYKVQVSEILNSIDKD